MAENLIYLLSSKILIFSYSFESFQIDNLTCVTLHIIQYNLVYPSPGIEVCRTEGPGDHEGSPHLQNDQQDAKNQLVREVLLVYKF